ncbi:MAG: hypothetical protein SNJ54_04480 [Anaerolineae bacterium]
MQQLEQLWKVVALAGQVRDLAQETRRYQFQVEADVTFYAHVEHALVQISYHDAPEITIDALYQAQFGWRAQIEQDEHGVYLVARRRPVVGSVSTARFQVVLPRTVYTVLRLENAAYSVSGLTQDVHLPPLIQNK